MNEGKLISLEGCEGSGKSSICERLKAEFADDPRFLLTRQPGGTKIGKQIRKILLDPENKAMAPLTELLLFYADRAQHIDEMIGSALREGKIVVSDRADSSTIAYQLFGRERVDEWWRDALYLVNLIWRNSDRYSNNYYDGIIYLDIDPEIGLRRRAQNVSFGESRIDDEKLEFHKRVREGFLAMSESNVLGHWRVVDASRTPDEVYADVLKIIKSISAAQ